MTDSLSDISLQELANTFDSEILKSLTTPTEDHGHDDLVEVDQVIHEMEQAATIKPGSSVKDVVEKMISADVSMLVVADDKPQSLVMEKDVVQELMDYRDTLALIKIDVFGSRKTIKDLKIKGSSQVAKQGTAVRNIRLDRENETFIEGKVGPTLTVIFTEYVKKI